jgi:hypothetical protein
MSTGIPPALEPHFKVLHSDLAALFGRWEIYKQLFGVDVNRVDLLNSVAAGFFGTIQEALMDDILSRIARITDNPQTGKHENLVIRRLLDGLKLTTNHALIAQLETTLGAIEAACEPIEKVRDKRLAHRDLQLATTPVANPLPPITREQIGLVLSTISEFMNAFSLPFTGNAINYAETIPAPGDAESLVRSLRRAVEYRRLEREGRVPRIGTLPDDA